MDSAAAPAAALALCDRVARQPSRRSWSIEYPAKLRARNGKVSDVRFLSGVFGQALYVVRFMFCAFDRAFYVARFLLHAFCVVRTETFTVGGHITPHIGIRMSTTKFHL